MEPFAINEIVIRFSCCSVVACVQCFLSYTKQLQADPDPQYQCIKCRTDLDLCLLAATLIDFDAPKLGADDLDHKVLNFELLVASCLDFRRGSCWLRVDIDPVGDVHNPRIVFGQQRTLTTPQPILTYEEYVTEAEIYADDEQMELSVHRLTLWLVRACVVAHGLRYRIFCEIEDMICILEALQNGHQLFEWTKSHHDHSEALSLYFSGDDDMTVQISLGGLRHKIWIGSCVASGRFAGRCLVTVYPHDGLAHVIESDLYNKDVQELLDLMLMFLTPTADNMMSNAYEWHAIWQPEGDVDFFVMNEL